MHLTKNMLYTLKNKRYLSILLNKNINKEQRGEINRIIFLDYIVDNITYIVGI